MKSYEQEYLKKLNNYLQNPPIIEINGETYLDKVSLKNAIIDSESNFINKNLEQTQYIENLGTLLKNYTNFDNIELIMEIDNLLRKPQHLKSINNFSNLKINFKALIQDLMTYHDDSLELLSIARILSRDDFICKIIYLNHKLNNIVSTCINLDDDSDLEKEKINTRMLINTRAQETINKSLSMNELVFKYLIKNAVCEYHGQKYALAEYFDTVVQSIEKNFKQNLINKGELKALAELRQDTAKAYSNLYDSLSIIDKKFSELTMC